MRAMLRYVRLYGLFALFSCAPCHHAAQVFGIPPDGADAVRRAVAERCDISGVIERWWPGPFTCPGHTELDMGCDEADVCGGYIDVMSVTPAWKSAQAYEYGHICLGLDDRSSAVILAWAAEVNAEAEGR